MLSAARKSGDDASKKGRKHGYRNEQATVLARRETHRVLMDCDTTGIAPDIAIVTHTALSRCGMPENRQQYGTEACQRLRYYGRTAPKILAYMMERDISKASPELKPAHLTVFDCDFKPGMEDGSIHYMGQCG